MHAKKFIFAGLTLFITLLLTACQGTNSDSSATDTGSAADGNGTLPIVEQNSTALTLVLPVSSTVLTTNSQVVNIEVRMFDAANNPYSEGIITKVNPNDVLLGRDIGTFDKDISTLVNGVATFVYTAPANLELNTSNINFSFYHESNSSDARVYTMSIVPEVNQTILTDYELVASNQNNLTIDLESSKSVSYSLIAGNNELVPDSNISSMTVTLLNPNLVTLQDSYGNSGSTLTIANKNAFSINIVSGTRSGLVPIKVDTTYFDSNNVEQNLSKVFDLVVLSGPPTAISLSYAGTDLKSDYAKFVENWVLTVTDKYNNLINSNPTVSMGAIIGYAQSSAATSNAANYLFYPSASGSGTLSDADPDTFTAAANAFDNVDLVNDKLVLLGGTGYKFNAYGKWDIENILSSNQLQLLDDFEGTDVSDLGFAVGNNFRNEVCDGYSRLANVYPRDGNTLLASNGSMVLQIEYDYYLTGKDIILWTNIVGSNNNQDLKVGLANKITLRGQGLVSPVYEFTSAFTGTVRLNVSIANTPEFYKNGNFGYLLKVTGQGVVANVVGTSMSDGDITNCALNNGIGYVDVQITSGGSNGGSIELTNVLPSSEF